MQVQAIINYFFIYISKDTCKNSSSEIFEIKDVPSTYDKSTKNLVFVQHIFQILIRCLQVWQTDGRNKYLL